MSMYRSGFKGLAVGALLACAGFAGTSPLHAATAITFAEFSGASANWFSYTGTAPNGGTLAGNTTVNFAALGLGFTDYIQGTKFKLTASSNTAPSSWANNTNSSQIFQTGTLTFKAPTAYANAHGGKSNLLTVTFQNGALNVTPLGSKNTGFAVTDGKLQFDGSTSQVTYSSDFFDFSGTKDYDFAFSLTGTSKKVTASGGAFVNFKASGPGSFAAAVPEPSQWAMLLVGFGMVGASVRRRQRPTLVTA